MEKNEKIINDDDILKNAIIDGAVQKLKNGEIKSFGDVENYLDELLKPLLQKMLDTELECHLDYGKYEHKENKNSNNTRNGYCNSKTVKTKYGEIEVKTPRDREGTFEPIIIEKGQNRMNGFEEKCISLYAKGMSLRDIEDTLSEFYGVKISKDSISKLISVVNEEVEAWKNRRLKPFYIFTYADCLYIPMKEDLVSKKKAVYVMIGVDANGYKDVLGLWIDKTESASFWNNVFEDLKRRGVEDILYMCSDGVAGFKGSLEEVFHHTQTQRCVVHLHRNIGKICPKKHIKEVSRDFKKIYSSSSLEEAILEFNNFKEQHKVLPQVVDKVSDFMQYLEPLFELPDEIRKAIYTTNVVESVNSALRKVTDGKGSFPSEEAVFKVLYLRINELTKKWSKPIRNFKVIQKQLIELFGDRYTKYLEI